ncbi:hypothetical protein CGCF415_v008783 [Colletotrichum fructicola]|nr:Satratoxin biosynthesis SC1 cluster protein 4 [Colletotrichum fructicola]KAF4885527.1 hypothetical protein CGCFRS4_v011892 [Colletotrichum fructicola]KAF4904014.1 hypothetical protein CGCF415_v008783 [Colletotrichum fructicola]KAF4929854.1 hypothetical protein CGCF245_v011968 [Colletotrichum fructicola]
MTSFIELIGKADNLHDAKPAINNRSVMLGIVISFLIFTLLCALMRLFTRVFIVKAAGWDDFFVVLVMISISIGSIGTCIATDHGLGEHLLKFPELQIDLSVFLKIFYICNGTLPMSTTFIKIAILLQYLRTFEKGSKSYTLTIVMIVLTSMWGIAFMFLAWVPCIPVRGYWDWSQPTIGRWGFGTQVAEDLIKTYEAHATSNMLLDFIIFAIPLPLYFNKEANKRSRKGVLGLFLLGSVVLMLSAWRLVSLVRSRAGTYPTLDPTWYAPVPMVLAILEIDVAAICASLPVFWPVLRSGIGQIFVTHEVKVEVTTEEYPRDDDLDLELAHCPGTSFSYSQPSPTADTDKLFEVPETRIFGAYMQGKTTTEVTKVG